MKKALIIFLSISLFTSFDMVSQSKKELTKQKEKEEYLETKKLIESGKYIFQANGATTSSGQNVTFANEGYIMTMNDKKTSADFPFYGGSGGVAAYGGGGIKFEGGISDFNIKHKDKKNKLTVNFKIKGGSEMFYVTLNVNRSGRSILIVTSTARSSMSYYGFLKEMKEKSKV